jgi:hypothetical protein
LGFVTQLLLFVLVQLFFVFMYYFANVYKLQFCRAWRRDAGRRTWRPHRGLEPAPTPLPTQTTSQFLIRQLPAVLRIRIRMFLGLPDPDPLVRGMDPDPSIIYFVTLFDFLSLKNDVKCLRKVISRKNITKIVCRFRFSLVNLRQRVAKIGFPPPLDVTRPTQGTQNSGEQQSMNRASSS